MGNKVIKTKLTNILRVKEGKKRKNRHKKLNRWRWRRFITLKINCKGENTVGKANKGINVERYNRFKKLKWKFKKREKKNRKLHRTAKAWCRGRGL